MYYEGVAKRSPSALAWGVSQEVNMSETSVCRKRLSQYCNGNGVDIGSGGDSIVPIAIAIDLPQPYNLVGTDPIHLSGDATKLHWFTDECLDYVYSSHLIEDFNDTVGVLTEWWRVIKVKGVLVIVAPVEEVYREQASPEQYNQAHIYDDFNIEYIINVVENWDDAEIVYLCPLIDNYSFNIVIQKIKKV